MDNGEGGGRGQGLTGDVAVVDEQLVVVGLQGEAARGVQGGQHLGVLQGPVRLCLAQVRDGQEPHGGSRARHRRRIKAELL